MKISCNIIRDLLPLYLDQVCSEESKDMIENHLTECENCREYYDQMSADVPDINIDPEESADPLDDKAMVRKLSRRITSRQFMITGITLIVVFIIGCFLNSPDFSSASSPFIDKAKETVLETIPVLDSRISTDKITPGDAYRLEDGSIYCSFTVNSSFSSFSECYVTDQDGEQKLHTNYFTDFNALAFQKSIDDRINELFHINSSDEATTFYMVVPEKSGTWPDDVKNPSEGRLVIQDTSGVYCVGKGGEILALWEKGQPLSQAPQEIEKLVADERAMMEEDYAQMEENPEETDADEDEITVEWSKDFRKNFWRTIWDSKE